MVDGDKNGVEKHRNGQPVAEGSGPHGGAQAQPACSDRYPGGNAMDMADIVGVVLRRKWWIAVSVLIFGVLAATASSLMTEKYMITSIVEVGKIHYIEEPVALYSSGITISNKLRGYRYIEEPEATVEKIKGMSKLLYRDLSIGQSPKFPIDGLQIRGPRKSGVVNIELEAPKTSRAVPFLKDLNAKLLKNHDRIIKIEKQKYRTEINNLKSDLKEYKKKKSTYVSSLKAVEQEEAFLKKQAASADQQMDRILSIKTKANLKAQEPLGQLLFANEMHRIQEHKDELQTRLFAEIPEKRETLTIRIQEMETKMENAENELEMLRVELENVISTNVLMQPQFSKEPTSPNMKLNVALAVMAGLFFGILMAFVIEFWENNKQKIRRKDECRSK